VTAVRRGEEKRKEKRPLRGKKEKGGGERGKAAVARRVESVVAFGDAARRATRKKKELGKEGKGKTGCSEPRRGLTPRFSARRDRDPDAGGRKKGKKRDRPVCGPLLSRCSLRGKRWRKKKDLEKKKKKKGGRERKTNTRMSKRRDIFPLRSCRIASWREGKGRRRKGFRREGKGSREQCRCPHTFLAPLRQGREGGEEIIIGRRGRRKKEECDRTRFCVNFLGGRNKGRKNIG